MTNQTPVSTIEEAANPIIDFAFTGEKINWLTNKFRQVTYWLAADHYDNHSGTVAEDQYMREHTHKNSLFGAPMTIPAGMGGGALGYLLTFGTLPLTSTVAAGLLYGLSYYAVERNLFSDMRKETAYKRFSANFRKPFSEGLVNGLRVPLAVLNAGIIGVAYSTYLFQPEIDHKLYLLDQQKNAELYSVFDTTTASSKQRSQDLTGEIDKLQTRLAQQEEFLAQLTSGEFDIEASPAIINLREEIIDVEADISGFEAEISQLEQTIRGKQNDVRLYTDIIQAETLGRQLTVTLSTGDTVETSSAAIAGCGPSCEGLKSQQENLRFEIQSDQQESVGLSNSMQALQETHTELLKTVRDLVAQYESDDAKDELMAETESTIAAIEGRITKKTNERSAQLAITQLAFEEMQSDPTYIDPYSPSNIISSIAEIKDENLPAVSAYTGSVAGLIFLLEIYGIVMMKMSGATSVSGRRARKEIEDIAKNASLTEIANANLKANELEVGRKKAFVTELTKVLNKDKNLSVQDRDTIMVAMKDMVEGTLDNDGISRVSDLIEARKQAIASQSSFWSKRKTPPSGGFAPQSPV